jgi:hypothetical protein
MVAGSHGRPDRSLSSPASTYFANPLADARMLRVAIHCCSLMIAHARSLVA